MFRWQKRITRIESWCDTDHAGCIWTRKSVSGCALMLGNSTVCTYCEGQAVIALSSGEAECYGLVTATSQMLGLQSILLDWGWKFKAHVWMDATAGIAIGSRRGLGRVKHTDTAFLRGTGEGHGRQDLAWKEAHQGNACRPFNETCRRCNDAELRSWIGNEISIRRESLRMRSSEEFEVFMNSVRKLVDTQCVHDRLSLPLSVLTQI